jgi:hypothetical protein
MPESRGRHAVSQFLAASVRSLPYRNGGELPFIITSGLNEIDARSEKVVTAFMRKWLIAAAVVILLVPVVAIYVLGPTIHAIIRDRTEKVLRTHFASQVELSDFQVSFFPHVRVTIIGLVMRHNGRTDIPPLFQMSKVTMDANFLSLLGGKPRITLVNIEGLQIHTPPRQPGAVPLLHGTDQDLAKKYPVTIEELHADDAVIVVLREQPDKPPREFPIHHLLLRDLNFDRPAQFVAALTNAIPKGEINATGQFGPWEAEEPSETPASGKYDFENADMGTLKGLKGTLSSTGEFSGPLDYLSVEGKTDIPDFSLRTTDHPMALHTDFSAIVDGTNGDTYLNSVVARFLRTTLFVKGKIVDEDRDIKGRTIILDAVSNSARVEDLIRLATKGARPLMTGDVRLRTKITIPEGDPDLISRLRLQGQFGIGDAQFTSPSVQEKVDTLSRKGQGQPENMEIGDVVSELKGSFGMRDAVLNFTNLAFGVQGAAIDLTGTYNLDTEGLDFHGKLKLQAKPSQTTTGVKSLFLKALDPFFKGKDAGTVLAIKITGTKDNPSFGLDHGSSSSNASNAASPKGQ